MATQEEIDLEEYYKKQALMSAGAGALSGAGTGAAVGSIIPVVGTGIGAAVGAGIGAGVGLYQNSQSKKAAQAAIERDAEIKGRLDSVDNLGDFAEVIGLQTSESAVAGRASAQQAAARGGLSGAQRAGLLASSDRAQGQARTAALAGALAPARAADRAEKSRILQEEAGRQQLMDDASLYGPDLLGALGEAGGLAVQLAGTTAGNNNRGTGGVMDQTISGGRSSQEVTINNIDELSGGRTLLGSRKKNSNSMYGYERNGDPGVKTFDELDAMAEEYGKESEQYQRAATKLFTDEAIRAEGVDPEAVKITQTKMQLDVQEGRITEEMFNELLTKYPDAVTSPQAYETALASMMKSKADAARSAGPGKPTVAPLGVDDLNYPLLSVEHDLFVQQLLNE